MSADKPSIDSPVTRDDALAVLWSSARRTLAYAESPAEFDPVDVMSVEERARVEQAAAFVLAVIDQGQSRYAETAGVSRQAVHDRYRRACAIVAEQRPYAHAHRESHPSR